MSFFYPFIKRRIVPLLVVFLTTLSSSFTAHAAYIKNLEVTLTNPDGTTIECYASGDEFFNYLHDKNGYTIIQGDDGYYYYAELANNKLIASKHRVNSINPRTAGLKSNILISQEEYQQRVSSFWNGAKSSGGKAPHQGTINNIVIYIRFIDDDEFTTERYIYDDKFNKEAGPSLKHYYQEVSYGLLDIESHHFPHSELNTNISYIDIYPRVHFQPYSQSNSRGYRTENDRRIREHELLERAIKNLESKIPEDLVLDYDNDGNVDNVCFIIKGKATGWNSLLWAHRWVLYSKEVSIHGKRVWDYTFQPENQVDVTTLSHEMFHALGAPDLYRYSQDGFTPVGDWDIMEYGGGHMGAYMKYKYAQKNWITEIPVISKPGKYILNPLTSNTNNAYRINSPFTKDEFFVVEYRKAEGIYEGRLPNSGLIIYRINTRAGDGNSNGPPDEVHVFRPDGGVGVNGSIKDAALSASSDYDSAGDFLNPALFLSDGSLSGIIITDISEADETISFMLQDGGYYSVNLTAHPEGTGLAWDVTNGTPYEEGDEVTVKASPIHGFEFISWSNEEGDVVSTDQEFTFTIEKENVSLTANFNELENFAATFEVVDQYDNPVKDVTILVKPKSGKAANYTYSIPQHGYTHKSEASHAPMDASKIRAKKHTLEQAKVAYATAKETEEEGQWIHWDKGEYKTSIGLGEEGSFSVASRWTSDDLQPYDGLYISMLNLFLCVADAQYTLKIWIGDNPVEIISQEITEIKPMQWNRVVIETPFQINAEHTLWFGYEVYTKEGYPAGCDSGPAVNNKGNMIFYNGQWVALKDLNSSLNYNWNIQAYTSSSFIKYTDPQGVIAFKLLQGEFDFEVTKGNYSKAEDSFSILDTDLSIPIVLERGPTYSAIFEVKTKNDEPIENVLISMNEETQTTDAEGIATFSTLDPGQYSYEVSEENYHAHSGSITIEDSDYEQPITLIPVSVFNETMRSLNLYPNPFTNLITIDGIMDVEDIIVTNILGQIVLKQKHNNRDSVTLNTSDFSKGIHLLTLQYNDGSKTVMRIIKK